MMFLYDIDPLQPIDNIILHLEIDSQVKDCTFLQGISVQMFINLLIPEIKHDIAVRPPWYYYYNLYDLYLWSFMKITKNPKRKITLVLFIQGKIFAQKRFFIRS